MIDILEFIPYGKTDSPISRESLCYLTGLSDRSVREEIARAKKEYPIINVGEGYYIPDDPDDPNLKAYILKETHRIREISKGLKRHKALYRVNKKQETLEL